MLGKLIKHEFKNSYLEISIINGAIMAITILCAILIQFDHISWLLLPLFSQIGLYFAAFVLLIINVIRSFHQKMFSKEGYLTLTLPVSIDHIIFSKLIVNLIWFIITAVVFIISLLIGLTIISEFKLNFFDWRIEPKDFLRIGLYLIQAIVSVIFFLVTLFLTLTLLNIGKIRKMKLLAGVGIYYGISSIASGLKTFLQIIPLGIFVVNEKLVVDRLPNSNDPFDFRFWNGLFSFNDLLINVVLIIGLYLLGRLLITKKLELE